MPTQDFKGTLLGVSTQNIFDNAKTQLINAVYGIVTSSNVKGFWIFDQTGAVSTITDRSTIGGATAHTATLRDASFNAVNASTCSPGVSGVAPYLVFDSTHCWDTPDSADFSFGNGTDDSVFSIITLFNPTVLSSTILAKEDVTTGTTQREWRLWFASNLLQFILIDDSAAGSISRYYNASLAGDIGSWHTYITTYDATELSAGIKIYRDGGRIDDTTYTEGAYVAMENKGAVVGSYFLDTAGSLAPSNGKYGVVCIVAEELTTAQILRLDIILRGYAGVAI
jgi:hypothetical protein